MLLSTYSGKLSGYVSNRIGNTNVGSKVRGRKRHSKE